MIRQSTWTRVRRAVWRLLSKADVFSEVPSDEQLEKMARLQMAAIVESEALTSLHACISVSDKGLVIRINPRLDSAHRRYAIAHEIGHTLIDGDVPVIRSRLSEKIEPPLNLADEERERVCDRIAAEILVPKPIFLASLQSTGVPAALAAIAHRLHAPDDALLTHLASRSKLQLGFGL